MKWPWVGRARLEESQGSLLTQSQRVTALETQLGTLHTTMLSIVHNATKGVVVPPSPVVLDPEQSALTAIKDETIDRMAEAFQLEGMDKATAADVARSLAKEAELLFG